MGHPKHLQLNFKKLNKNAKKYWKQRYGLFSKFDEGILMNQELWFSVTPEKVAIFIAKLLRVYFEEEYKGKEEDFTVMDVFCGGGGNTIQLAKRFQHVIALDINSENLYCAENNCYVYGLNENVEFLEGDWIGMDKTRFKEEDNVDVIFASPPWGGPGYKSADMFDLDYLLPVSLKDLLESFFKITQNVCLFLPRNSNVQQISEVTKELLGDKAKCKIIYAYSEGFLKGMFVLYGKFAAVS